MFFILYKQYFLSPYTNTPKPSPYRKLYAFLDLKKNLILYDLGYNLF